MLQSKTSSRWSCAETVACFYFLGTCLFCSQVLPSNSAHPTGHHSGNQLGISLAFTILQLYLHVLLNSLDHTSPLLFDSSSWTTIHNKLRKYFRKGSSTPAIVCATSQPLKRIRPMSSASCIRAQSLHIQP